MKIAVTDKQGTGIMVQFAQALGATVQGRFFHIPENKGAGYITGFSWGKELRMMIRNYYLIEDVLIERTNELAEGQDDIIFFLGGIFTAPLPEVRQMLPEPPTVFICRQEVSSVLNMPSDTSFRSITIAASRAYLREVFGNLSHPIVNSLLQANEQFAFETRISPQMIKAVSEMMESTMPESLENQYYKLKCEELLCYIFALLVQREELPTGNIHIEDIKSIYALKLRLLSNLNIPPDIGKLAAEASMSEPKMRKLFKQTFGKGVFEYYQFMRMQEAASLLKEKRLSVAEVGYELGFTNLSHFSRVFAQHMGSNPKKYSLS